jgi:hypothetical protein
VTKTGMCRWNRDGSRNEKYSGGKNVFPSWPGK